MNFEVRAASGIERASERASDESIINCKATDVIMDKRSDDSSTQPELKNLESERRATVGN